jgi:hypothetical protein
MIRAAIAEERVYQSWLAWQEALRRAVAPLTAEQLRHRPIPGRRTPGELAQHIVFGRALHLHRALREAVPTVMPFLSWDATDTSRSADEIVHGLEVTWQAIVECVMGRAAIDEIPMEAEVLSMQVIWGLLDHDLPHAGQLSLVLRASGLPGVEI